MYKKAILTIVCALLVLTSMHSSTARAQGIPYRVSDRQLEQTMKRLKRDTDRYRKSLDSSLDRSRLDGTNREDDINAFIKNFDQETDRLHDRFKDRKSVSADVETVLDRASRIDRFMVNRRLGGRAERDWSAVRADLDQLSQAYNVRWNWTSYSRY